MPHDRDIAAFDERAPGYETGWRGRLHHEIADRTAGLAGCARALIGGGRLVLVDQFSAMLLPTLLGTRRGKARTRRRATRLLTGVGFQQPRWHDLCAVIIKAVTAEKR